MDEFNKTEYQVIILSALFHDIGKFYQRALPKRTGSHEDLGEEVFNKFFTEKLSSILNKNQINKIRSAISSHHSYAEIISLADALSAGMERKEIKYSLDTHKEKQQSIFQMVSLGNHKVDNKYKFNLKPLSLLKEDVFPFIDLQEKNLQENYSLLWNSFLEETKKINCSELESLINNLYYLFWKYTWCVPSAVFKSIPDISLFDHLKTTATIAGCLFVKRNEHEPKSNEEFLVLAGDLSGIQNFIYKITNVEGVSGVAKRLRGRSFYLTLMEEIFAHYILKILGLSISHLIFCGGGRFELLLPNTGYTIKSIVSISKEINKWLLDNYAGELGLVIEWVTADIKSIKSYSDILKTLDAKLSEAKKRKFKDFLGEDFFWKRIEKLNEEIRVCRCCNNNIVHKGVNNEICPLCEEHKLLGEKLPKTKYLAYEDQPYDYINETFIKFGKFGVVYLLEKENPKLNCYKINDISGKFKLIGNTVPLVLRGFKQDTEENNYAEEGNILNFETIADMSIGDKRIGILKMDIDYLGLIFALGLKDDEKSISRITSISRGLEWFFSGYLNVICENVFKKWKDNADKAGWKDKADNIKNIFYTVYSGGDDLLIIGPWSEIPILAQEIRNEFKDYTCNNIDIDLSAGIYICKPKFPISIFSKQVGEELKDAKDKGRKRIKFFGDTVKWNKDEDMEECCFDSLLEFGEILYQSIISENADNRLKRSFLHNLLKQYRQYKYGQDINFIPAIIYQIERNIKKSSKINTLKGEQNLKEYLWERLISNKDGYFKKIKIPASYALLKSRKEG